MDSIICPDGCTTVSLTGKILDLISNEVLKWFLLPLMIYFYFKFKDKIVGKHIKKIFNLLFVAGILFLFAGILDTTDQINYFGETIILGRLSYGHEFLKNYIGYMGANLFVLYAFIEIIKYGSKLNKKK